MNSKCGVQSNRKCESHESCVCIVGFSACECQKKSVPDKMNGSSFPLVVGTPLDSREKQRLNLNYTPCKCKSDKTHSGEELEQINLCRIQKQKNHTFWRKIQTDYMHKAKTHSGNKMRKQTITIMFIIKAKWAVPKKSKKTFIHPSGKLNSFNLTDQCTTKN